MKQKILLLSLAVTLLAACDNNDSETPANPTAEARIDYEIDVIADDISMIAEDQFLAAQSDAGKSQMPNLPDCATVTMTTSGNTWTRTIDFGDGCQMPGGNLLSGIIIISGTMDFDAQQATISYTFDDFHHNSRLVEGNRTIVRTMQSTDANPELHPVANISVDMTVTYPNGNIYQREGNRVREFIAGFATPNIIADNVFSIDGAWSTTFPNGTVRASEVLESLIRQMNCPKIVSGTLEIVRNGNTAILDYGDGECDNVATLTINGETSTITLGN